jgi:hypothetical protein
MHGSGTPLIWASPSSGCTVQPGHGRCGLHLVGTGTALQLPAELDCMSCNNHINHKSSPQGILADHDSRKPARAVLPSDGDAVRLTIDSSNLLRYLQLVENGFCSAQSRDSTIHHFLPTKQISMTKRTLWAGEGPLGTTNITLARGLPPLRDIDINRMYITSPTPAPPPILSPGW